jgi:DNA-binding transcriptional MerR regulator
MEHPIGTGVIDFSRYNGLSLDEIRAMMNEGSDEPENEPRLRSRAQAELALFYILEALEGATLDDARSLSWRCTSRYDPEKVIRGVRAALRDLDERRASP